MTSLNLNPATNTPALDPLATFREARFELADLSQALEMLTGQYRFDEFYSKPWLEWTLKQIHAAIIRINRGMPFAEEMENAGGQNNG